MTPVASTIDAARERERFLRLASVEELTGLKKSAIYAGMKAGSFPGSVRLGRRCVVWRDSQIQTWIAERCAAAEAQ